MMRSMLEMRGAKLSDILLQLGVVTKEQLDSVMEHCDAEQRKLGELLVAKGCTTADKMIKAVSIRLGITCFMSFEGMIRPDAVALVPESMARRWMIIPVMRTEDSLTIGMANPLDLEAVDAVARHTGLRVRTVMTTTSNLFASIQRAYGRAARAPVKAPDVALASLLEPERFPERPARPKEAAAAAPAAAAPGPAAVEGVGQSQTAVEFADMVLREGIALRASDIHIEMAEKAVRVRYRVDGMLRDGRSIDKSLAAAIVTRIKILAKLDITETRLPQDGHLRAEQAGAGVDVRVSALPTLHGEKLVLRVLDTSKAVKKLEELDLSAANVKAFSSAITRPNGIVLVTGPTGSGKTTTLYAAVSRLNDETRNIVTLEDPVEYRLERVNQVQMQPKIGLTFATGLRSVLRQDPNVILVGEIRDLETAEIAIQAAVTGHLVFSTLHTNDAAATIHRLLNMRVEPYLLSAALGGVMAQRLVRRLCDQCKRKHALTKEELQSFGADLPAGAVYYEAAGCDACRHEGYSGRLAVHEWMSVSRAIRELILERASLDALREKAQAEGMATLQEDALQKAARGLTSLSEVVRVTREDKES